MAINANEIFTSMFSTAQGVLSEKWPEIKDYAESEFKKLAESIVTIEKLKITNQINEEQAKLHLQIQKNATRTVLLTIEGLGILAVEQAINAALAVVKDTINNAIGFVLI